MDPCVHLTHRNACLLPPGEIFLNSFRRLSINHKFPARIYSPNELESLLRPTPARLGDFPDELQVAIISFMQARDIQTLSHTTSSYQKILNASLVEKVSRSTYDSKLECYVVPPIQSLHLLEWYHRRGQTVNTGSIHSVVIQDGCAFGFGANGNGQLGQNSTKAFGIPKQIHCRRVAMVACGDGHTALLCWDSTLYSFGRGKYGALGHGTEDDVSYPKQLSYFAKLPGFGAPRMIAAGQDHTLVVSDGLYGCGWNDFNQLGGVSSEAKLSPELISKKQFIDVDGGFGHTIGVDRHGVWAIGLNTHGQLGLGHRSGSVEFVKVLLPREIVGSGNEYRSDGSRIHRVSSGSYHNLILTVDGVVYSFGHGAQGKLGLGDSHDRLEPCRVDGFFSSVIHVNAGMAHSLCIDADQRLYTFGMGRRGQLGIMEKACVMRPKIVRSNVVEAAGGGYHSLFRTVDGLLDTIEACGRATRGQLGIIEEFAQEEDHNSPVVIRNFSKRRRLE